MAVAFQEITCGSDLLEVLLAADVADARCGAIFQVRIEAMTIVALAGRERPATAQIILAANQGQRAAQCARIRKRSKVTRAVILFESREGESGDRIVKINLQQEKSFVVSKTDIVAGMKFLNQFAFEQ